MSRPLSESRIVEDVARAAGKGIAQQVMAELQQMPQTLTGDDSVLETVWEEVCVQVQYEQSYAWDFYHDTVVGIIARHMTALSEYETEAIRLQTNAGEHWSSRDPDDREKDPVWEGDYLFYVANDYVYSEAGRWTNARIREYLDNSA